MFSSEVVGNAYFLKCSFSQLPKGQMEEELILCKINSIKKA